MSEKRKNTASMIFVASFMEGLKERSNIIFTKQYKPVRMIRTSRTDLFITRINFIIFTSLVKKLICTCTTLHIKIPSDSRFSDE